MMPGAFVAPVSSDPKEAKMANHSPDPNNYVVSKTWDEAMNDKPASGEVELPQLAEAVKQTEDGGAAANNGGGTAAPAKATKTAPKAE